MAEFKGFRGWYHKHQHQGRTLALIPGRAQDRAFIQIITDQASYLAEYGLEEYEEGACVRVGNSTFSAQGARLNIHTPDVTLTGHIRYGPFTVPRANVMGPFRHLPMECKHGVVSLRHALYGQVVFNGEPWPFEGGRGYIETDSGTSFPKTYTWVHSNDFDMPCSVVAAVAEIPLFGLTFTGCVCLIWLEGREYRLATDRGVKVVENRPGRLILRQGRARLEIEINGGTGHRLLAPQAGMMCRTVREVASCPAWFRFEVGDRAILDACSEQTSYELVP